jgi:hypothetical protein
MLYNVQCQMFSSFNFDPCSIHIPMGCIPVHNIKYCIQNMSDPMCEPEVFASLGHPRIFFDCIHSIFITEILLPPLPPPCLLEVWYRLFQTVFNVIMVALCRLCYVVFVMCNAAHNSSMWTYFYFLFLCPMPTSVLRSFAK